MAGRRIAASCLFCLLVAVQAFAQGTVMPSPIFTGFDTNGNPVSGGKLCTYLAGTVTPQATYTNSALTVANTNPVILSSAGRATVYLNPGTSYKFTLLNPGTDATCATGSTIWSVDNVTAVPTTSGNVDVLGTAGEALTAGQAVYLSDGSNAKTAGQWFKSDATNPYSSSVPAIGFAIAAITSGAVGTIRTHGQITGLSSLTVGSTYYVSATPGGVTLTAPTNNIRKAGVADSTSSLVLNANPATTQVDINQCNGRLSLTTAVPITITDVTAATSVRFVPYKGNRCALYDGSWWTTRTFTELSIAVPATTNTNYDVFLYDNAGTLALELSAAWTSDTARFASGTYATNLPIQDSVYVKSTNGTAIDATRRYLGSFRTTGVSGQTEDSLAKRLCWNYYNRVARSLTVKEATSSWTYTTATWREANGSTANQVAVIVGVAEVAADIQVVASATNTGINNLGVSIGENSTSATVAGVLMSPGYTAAGVITGLQARVRRYPAVGYSYYAWLEYSAAAGTTTWEGTAGTVYLQSGIFGWIDG